MFTRLFSIPRDGLDGVWEGVTININVKTVWYGFPFSSYLFADALQCDRFAISDVAYQ